MDFIWLGDLGSVVSFNDNSNEDLPKTEIGCDLFDFVEAIEIETLRSFKALYLSALVSFFISDGKSIRSLLY